MTEGRCPSCGGEVVFSAGSAQVVVCSYCQTVVVREGASLAAHGRIGRVVDTESPFRLGLHGRYQKVGFRIAGHLQKSQGKALWDEWYLAFDDGRTSWLAESEGALHLMFVGVDEVSLPLAELKPGHRFTLRNRRFAVEEIHHARTLAAEGELPSDVNPEVEGVAVDATGPQGVFATLDYGTGTDQPTVYFGLQVKLEELGIPPDQLQPKRKKVGLTQLRCNNCNGALELRAPDRTKRVACPYCGALLDASSGKLELLELLQKPPMPPKIPLGARGKLMDQEWICIGYLMRSCEVEGVTYPWDEYLLFHRTQGFVWLMESNGHWTYLAPLPAGDVALNDGASAHYDNRRFKYFQTVTATTDYVLGEFYWELEAGERAQASEYIAPPHSINTDETDSEITYTYGTYLETSVIAEAFGPREIERPMGIAPSQPNPHGQKARSGLTAGLVFATVLLALYVGASATAAEQTAVDANLGVPEGIGGSPEVMHFTPPFEIAQRGVLEFTVSSNVQNAWMGVQADLVNEDTQEVTSVYGEMSYYSGSDADGSWSEGSKKDTEYISSVPPGRYVLRLTPYYDGGRGPSGYRVRLVSDTVRPLWFWLAFLSMAIPIGLRLVLSQQFETKRWNPD